MDEELSPEDYFENLDPNLLQYVDKVDRTIDSPKTIFDDVLMIEERYQQSTTINQGGMKKILKTIDSLTGRSVAKATLIDFENSEKVEDFLKEARLTAALEHPNIIPVHDIGVDEVEGPFFTMKLVGGQNLAKTLKDLAKATGAPPTHQEDLKGYSLQELMEIFLKICDAVDYAHSRGIVHLDLKPDNIQIGDYGEVLVCDWGLAKVLESSEGITDFSADLDPYIYNGLTLDGTIKGSPGYMAPEQINTELGPKNQKTDIYALGGILYSLLCLKVPYESDTLEGILTKTLSGEIEPPSVRSLEGSSMIPSSLEAVALKALQVQASDRYQSVSELKVEINKWMHGFATEAENASFTKSFWLLMKRHKAVSFLLLILAFSATFTVYKFKQNEKVALANERKAKEALLLFHKERQEKGEINKISADQLFLLCQRLMNEFKFDFAMNIIEEPIGFQPNSEILNALKGEIHFYRQEFGKASSAFKKAGKKLDTYPYSVMQPPCEEYDKLVKQNGFVPANKLFSLTSKFEGIEKERLLNFEYTKFKLKENQKFEKFLENRPHLENHMEFCHLMIKRGDGDDVIDNFKYSFDKDGINLDISGSRYDPKGGSLSHLPLNSLNIARTKFWRKWVFSHYHLKSLDYRNSFIKKVDKSAFKKTKLKNVTLTQEQSLNVKLKLDGKYHGITFHIKPSVEAKK